MAQSSELPPPRATKPSTRAARAAAAPAATHVAVGVLGEVVEAGHADAGRVEDLLDPVGVAGPHHAGIADEQDVAQAELAGQRASALDDAGAEDQPRARLPVDEGRQDGEVHERGDGCREGCRKHVMVWSLTMPTACMKA